jgi:PHD/YefM family antitoxin component YafN of YafNO toxin-antitoxin module
MLILVLNPVLAGMPMNTIPAQEIKRCGISAVDELLKNGPVHIIKNNRPQYVVLTEEAYAQLTAQQLEQSDQIDGDSLWDWLERRPWKGTRTREEIDTYLRAERDAWDDER